MNDFLVSTTGGLIVGLMTMAGACLGYLGGKARHSTGLTSGLLSLDFALGMMIGAAGLSMIWPSASQVYSLGLASQGLFVLSLIAGWVFIRGVGGLLERRNPGNRVWLFVIAMSLHNIPEGLAAGVGLSELGFAKALSLVSLIGIQNLPEGLLCYLAFEALGFRRSSAFAAAALTGVFEIGGGVGAGIATQFFQNLSPYLLGFAGSAMLVVSVAEIKERIHTQESQLFWRNLTSGFGAIALFQIILL